MMKKRVLTLTVLIFVSLLFIPTASTLVGEKGLSSEGLSSVDFKINGFVKKTERNDLELALISPEVAANGTKRTAPTVTAAKKQWNFLVYMAAKNNLHSFALQNLREMMKIGSTNFVNIIVQFDGLGDHQIKRYYIEKGQVRLLETLDPSNDVKSGTPQSLYQFVKWASVSFPSDHVMLDVWNHGSGAKDPSIWGRLLMSQRENLFTFNSDSGLFELNKSFMGFDMGSTNTETRSLFQEILQRGIAFNDVDEVYIDNKQLRLVLDNISKLILGKKIDILFFDACHMSMAEIASKARPFASYLVGSPEVEPGRGHNYELLLEPLKNRGFTPFEFAKFAVHAYEKEYKSSYAEYTQAAVNLDVFDQVEELFKKLTSQLLTLYKTEHGHKLFDTIKAIRSNDRYTTEFYDSDYIDAGHLILSLTSKLREITSSMGNSQSITTVIQTCESLYGALKKAIIANVHGTSMPMSHGLGLYFPRRFIHTSYYKLTFDEKTSWSQFLKVFLQHTKPPRILSIPETEEFIVMNR